MDAALIQRVNSKLTDLAELQSREAATTLQRGWRQKRRAAAARSGADHRGHRATAETTSLNQRTRRAHGNKNKR